MNPYEPLIRAEDRPKSRYKPQKALSKYTIRELADLFEHITFWIANRTDGKFSDPFHVAVVFDRSSKDRNLDKTYGKLSLSEIVGLLQQFEFRPYKRPEHRLKGPSYRVAGRRVGRWNGTTKGLKDVGGSLQQFVFAVKRGNVAFARRLKGDPVKGYERDPVLLEPHHEFAIRKVLDALHHLKWNVTEANKPDPDFTLLARKIHVE
jgi:hypothetical protein